MSIYFFKTTLGGLIVGLCLIITASGALAKDVAGVVTAVSGTWLVDGEQIKIGRKLPVGTVIKAKEPNLKYAGIEVLLLDYTVVKRVCDRKGYCGAQIKLPDAVPETRNRSRSTPGAPGFWERVVTALNTSKLRRAPFRKTLARGASLPPDMVLNLAQGRVDISPVLASFAGQELLINIEAVNQATGDALVDAGKGHVLNWEGQGDACFDVPNGAAGLYRLTISTPAGSDYMPPGDVWVLLVAESSYHKIASEFANARALTFTWDRRTEPNAEDFLREFMATLMGENTR